ncbi:formylglycine-generating enzyme family protein [Dechloromonas sp. HYN0024]|nr:formylglycine-generating enzyme family protein [Dechloromonas sp. HYN0024]
MAMMAGLSMAAGVRADDSVPAPVPNWSDPTTGMDFVWIPPGCFQMGSGDGDAAEQPVHKVCVKGFFLGKYEVTQRQFNRLVDGHIGSYRGRSLPVDQVSWDDAMAMAQELSARSKAKLRLPTEAEWEYACRAGGVHDAYCGSGSLGAFAWGSKAPGGLHAVGDLRPNAWGLHDMSGNVREWTLDCWHDNYQGAPADGSAWLAGGDCAKRVERGGSWKGATSNLRAAKRSRTGAALQVNYIGFRLVREP